MIAFLRSVVESLVSHWLEEVAWVEFPPFSSPYVYKFKRVADSAFQLKDPEFQVMVPRDRFLIASDGFLIPSDGLWIPIDGLRNLRDRFRIPRDVSGY